MSGLGLGRHYTDAKVRRGKIDGGFDLYGSLQKDFFYKRKRAVLFFFFPSLLIRKHCAGLKPLSTVFLKNGHSILISEGLLDKLCMETDQIDLCDFLGCDFKRMKNDPVQAPKEANLALRVAPQRAPWDFLKGLQRTLGFLLLSIFFMPL